MNDNPARDQAACHLRLPGKKSASLVYKAFRQESLCSQVLKGVNG